MATVTCRRCGSSINDSNPSMCPKCGIANPLSDEAAAARRDQPYAYSKGGGSWWKWVLGVPVCLFVLMMAVGSLNSNPDKTRSRDVYELCLSDLASADRARNGTSNFIAGTCERLRGEFKAKYGVNP